MTQVYAVCPFCGHSAQIQVEFGRKDIVCPGQNCGARLGIQMNEEEVFQRSQVPLKFTLSES